MNRSTQPSSAFTSAAHEPRGRVDQLVRLPFDQVPDVLRAHVYGVDYIYLPQPDGGELYLTRYGWPWRDQLEPDQWYDDRQYSRRGDKLPGGTGSVFCVASSPESGIAIKLVVKFSRMAQSVPLAIAADGAGEDILHEIRGARFNGPFEEFGRLMDLRRNLTGQAPDGPVGQPGGRMFTKRPLAIYCPGRRYNMWQLGRFDSRFIDHQRRLARDQDAHGLQTRPKLHRDRDYILLFAWVKGESIEACFDQGEIEHEEFITFTRRVQDELEVKGYRVLDNKPPHFIIRRRPNGEFVRRDGKLVYALIDFELLEPVGEGRRRPLQ